MRIREMMARNQAVVGFTAIACLVLGVALLVMRASQPTGAALDQGQVYFYDLGAKQLYAAANAWPPVTAPSGEEGVAAYVYACGECTEGNRTIGYLTRFDEAGKAMLGSGKVSAETLTEAEDKHKVIGLIARDGKVNWVPVTEGAAVDLVVNVHGLCPGRHKQCTP